MSHGVVVGPVIVATPELLVLGDGTEFAACGHLALLNLPAGTIVKIVYQVIDGSKVPVSITPLASRHRAG